MYDSPFYVNTRLRAWETADGTPRRAAVSSFGFSGTNAHCIIEEAPAVWRERRSIRRARNPAYLITLSARSAERLKDQARQLFEWCTRRKGINCADVSYTLLTGRQHFNHRLACVVKDERDLRERLALWLEKSVAPLLYVGKAQAVCVVGSDSGAGRSSSASRPANSTDSNTERLARSAELYVQGRLPDSEELFAGDRPVRIALPTYSSAKERYWVTAFSAAAPRTVEISVGSGMSEASLEDIVDAVADGTIDIGSAVRRARDLLAAAGGQAR
jgi:polyketide synthase PksM